MGTASTTERQKTPDTLSDKELLKLAHALLQEDPLLTDEGKYGMLNIFSDTKIARRYVRLNKHMQKAWYVPQMENAGFGEMGNFFGQSDVDGGGDGGC